MQRQAARLKRTALEACRTRPALVNKATKLLDLVQYPAMIRKAAAASMSL